MSVGVHVHHVCPSVHIGVLRPRGPWRSVGEATLTQEAQGSDYLALQGCSEQVPPETPGLAAGAASHTPGGAGPSCLCPPRVGCWVFLLCPCP